VASNEDDDADARARSATRKQTTGPQGGKVEFESGTFVRTEDLSADVHAEMAAKPRRPSVSRSLRCLAKATEEAYHVAIDQRA